MDNHRDPPPSPAPACCPPLTDLSPPEARRIDQLCDRFEAEWKAGRRPQPEDFLDAAGGPMRPVLLRQLLLLDWEYRRRAGEEPRAGDYHSRFPGDSTLIDYVRRAAAEPLDSTSFGSGSPRAMDTPWPGGRSRDAGSDIFAGAQAGAARYELVQEIGRGGIGVVFRARDRILGRELAVKVLSEDYRDSPDARWRFIQEAQVASQLQHPAIVPVYEQGVFADRRPYFTMKLVEGRTLSALLQDRADPARDLLNWLGVFEQVCQAVAYAHSKGVVHRDLKPANVMVGAFGEVQVMDWGFARVLRNADCGLRNEDRGHAGPDSSNPQPAFRNPQFDDTRAGSVMGTPAYMPPEQARGEAALIDPRSDVFALGAILCEILTGQPPYIGGTPDELACKAAVVDLEDARARLDASGADEAMRELAERCLSAERTDRPSDAGAVARCVTAYLTSAQERLRQAQLEQAAAEARAEEEAAKAKAERRARRLTLTLAAAILLLLLGAAVVPAVGYVLLREEQRQTEAARLDAVAAERDAVAARETAEQRLRQVEKGIAVLGSVFENLDPHAEEKEGRPLRAILGERLDQAAAELEGNAVGDPLLVARLQDRLARSYRGLGHPAKAETLFTKALVTRRALLAADDPLTLDTMHGLALAHRDAEKHNQALALLVQVRDAREKALPADHPDLLTTLTDLGWSYRIAGKLDRAIALLERVRDVRVKQPGPDHPDTLDTLTKLAGVYIGANRTAEAVKLLEQVYNARVREYGEGHAQSLAALNSLAFAHQAAGKMRVARELLEQARDRVVPQLGEDHPQTLKTLNNLAWVYRASGRTAEAIELGQRIRGKCVQRFGIDHPFTVYMLHNLALAYRAEGKLDKALPLFQQAAAGAEKRGFTQDEADRIIHYLCDGLEQLNRHDEAEVWRRKWLAAVKAKDGPHSTAYAEGLTALGSRLLRREKHVDAEPVLRESLAILEKSQPDKWGTFHTQSLLGAALLGQKKYADAEPLLVHASHGLSKFATKPGHQGHSARESLIEVLERLVQLNDAWGRRDKADEWRKLLEAHKTKQLENRGPRR